MARSHSPNAGASGAGLNSFPGAAMVDATQAMVARLLDEPDRLSMPEAARWVGSTQGGPPIHPATVTRWCVKGVKLPDGRRVRLEHVRVGGKLVTTKGALVRFFAAQTATVSDVAHPHTPSDRRRAADRAAAELEAMGA